MAQDTISNFPDRSDPQFSERSNEQSSSKHWFEYPIRVHPHHTDYTGVVWHGSYIAWMEEARIECLRQTGIEYADLVKMGCELPVVELATRYHRSLQFGMTAVVKTRMAGMKGVRMQWDYRIESVDKQELYITAQVTLVAVDREKGKIMRQLPAAVQKVVHDILMQPATYNNLI